MKLKRVKYIISEQLRKLKRQKLIREGKQMLNEVEITCCKEATFNAECCGAKRQECCDIDKEYGRNASGCCENIRPGTGPSLPTGTTMGQ